MLYVTYEKYKSKYYEAQQRYDEILSEKEKLFAKTQPGAMKFDKERVSGGTPGNPFEDYVIAKENKKIDERLEEIKSILMDRQRLLYLKEEELKTSSNIQDKVYKYKYIDKMTIEKIMRLVNYSRPQVFRILRTIKINLK